MSIVRYVRKVVQIATTKAGNSVYVVALCSDGTVWQQTLSGREWRQLPSIPDGEHDVESMVTTLL
jgi:hypothetical protein